MFEGDKNTGVPAAGIEAGSRDGASWRIRMGAPACRTAVCPKRSAP